MNEEPRSNVADGPAVPDAVEVRASEAMRHLSSAYDQMLKLMPLLNGSQLPAAARSVTLVLDAFAALDDCRLLPVRHCQRAHGVQDVQPSAATVK